MIQGGNLSKKSINIYGTFERGLVIIDVTMACDISNLVCFFSTKTMGIIKIHFGHCVGKYGPGTNLPHIFCAGIGLLQLDVVLVNIKLEKLYR